MVIFTVLMMIGAFVLHGSKASGCSKFEGDKAAWAKCVEKFAEESLTSNSGRNAISFTIGLVTAMGSVNFLFHAERFIQGYVINTISHF